VLCRPCFFAAVTTIFFHPLLDISPSGDDSPRLFFFAVQILVSKKLPVVDLPLQPLTPSDSSFSAHDLFATPATLMRFQIFSCTTSASSLLSPIRHQPTLPFANPLFLSHPTALQQSKMIIFERIVVGVYAPLRICPLPSFSRGLFLGNSSALREPTFTRNDYSKDS